MKIAIPVYGEYVSNVFDFSRSLLIVEIENGRVINRFRADLSGDGLQRAGKLKKMDVDVLICGAISEELASLVISCGVELISFVTGNVENVLDAYISGQELSFQFCMPGCRGRGGRGFRNRGRGCRWQRDIY